MRKPARTESSDILEGLQELQEFIAQTAADREAIKVFERELEAACQNWDDHCDRLDYELDQIEEMNRALEDSFDRGSDGDFDWELDQFLPMSRRTPPQR